MKRKARTIESMARDWGLNGDPALEAAALQAISRYVARRVLHTGVDPNEIVSDVVLRLMLEHRTLTIWRTYHVNDAFRQIWRKEGRQRQHLEKFAALRARELEAKSAAEIGDPAAILEEQEEAARAMRTAVRFVRRRDRRFLRWRRYRQKLCLPPGEAIRLAGFGRSVFFERKRTLLRDYLKRREHRPPE